jgi:hypothetical protein
MTLETVGITDLVRPPKDGFSLANLAITPQATTPSEISPQMALDPDAS